MKKGDKWYTFTFNININHYNKIIFGNIFAQNNEEALNKLPGATQKRIGFISKEITNINLYKKDDLIRHFTDFEEMLQELTKA